MPRPPTVEDCLASVTQHCAGLESRLAALNAHKACLERQVQTLRQNLERLSIVQRTTRTDSPATAGAPVTQCKAPHRFVNTETLSDQLEAVLSMQCQLKRKIVARLDAVSDAVCRSTRRARGILDSTANAQNAFRASLNLDSGSFEDFFLCCPRHEAPPVETGSSQGLLKLRARLLSQFSLLLSRQGAHCAQRAVGSSSVHSHPLAHELVTLKGLQQRLGHHSQ